jgi:exodeoxyribonuclease-3
MKVISFNINGLRARLHQLQALIDKHQPDVIGLQEIKVQDLSLDIVVVYEFV